MESGTLDPMSGAAHAHYFFYLTKYKFYVKINNMVIKKKEEIEILDNISKSLKDIALILSDVRRQFSNLNIEGLVKLIDIISDLLASATARDSHSERIAEKPEDFKWILSKRCKIT